MSRQTSLEVSIKEVCFPLCLAVSIIFLGKEDHGFYFFNKKLFLFRGNRGHSECFVFILPHILQYLRIDYNLFFDSTEAQKTRMNSLKMYNMFVSWKQSISNYLASPKRWKMIWVIQEQFFKQDEIYYRGDKGYFQQNTYEDNTDD
jgi:hypothetical protein